MMKISYKFHGFSPYATLQPLNWCNTYFAEPLDSFFGEIVAQMAAFKEISTIGIWIARV